MFNNNNRDRRNGIDIDLKESIPVFMSSTRNQKNGTAVPILVGVGLSVSVEKNRYHKLRLDLTREVGTENINTEFSALHTYNITGLSG